MPNVCNSPQIMLYYRSVICWLKNRIVPENILEVRHTEIRTDYRCFLNVGKQ